MDLLIETDLGHDPDDFFAICWLAAVGCRIRALTIVPGAPDQVRLAQVLRHELGQDFPIAVSKEHPKEEKAAGMHQRILRRHGGHTGQSDGRGAEVIAEAAAVWPEAAFLVIGPCSSIGRCCATQPDQTTRQALMQGGFLPYHLHDHPVARLPQFEGKDWVPTFNLNGDRKSADHFLAAHFRQRRWVGKNVCHTVVFDRTRYEQLAPPPNAAAELFRWSLGVYLEQHAEKKFHDPTAAACLLEPELGQWVQGRPQRLEGGWTTVLEGTDQVLAAVDYERLWERLLGRRC